jgi:hypothetical protein
MHKLATEVASAPSRIRAGGDARVTAAQGARWVAAVLIVAFATVLAVVPFSNGVPFVKAIVTAGNRHVNKTNQ